MSATRDNTQKVAFVFSNLYSIYQKGKVAAQEAVLPSEAGTQAPVQPNPETKPSLLPFAVTSVVSGPALVKSTILKADDLHKPEFSSVKIAEYAPTTMIGKRIARPQSIDFSKTPKPIGAVAGLKENLKALNDLHSRLRFMLQELEELVRK